MFRKLLAIDLNFFENELLWFVCLARQAAVLQGFVEDDLVGSPGAGLSSSPEPMLGFPLALNLCTQIGTHSREETLLPFSPFVVVTATGRRPERAGAGLLGRCCLSPNGTGVQHVSLLTPSYQISLQNK